MVAVNHMNHDVAEVNGCDPPMLPGSFLYEKEPGYEATPTPAGTSVFTKHNWDMGMGYLWLNGWGIYHLMGGAFMAYWVGHL